MALAINLAMLVVEMAGGWRVGSLSLLADIDFFGNAAMTAARGTVHKLLRRPARQEIYSETISSQAE